MSEKQEIAELKQRIKDAIRQNSDRGFIPYGGCSRVCGAIQDVLQAALKYEKAKNYHQAFDIYTMVLLEMVKIIPHADDSSGYCGDIIHISISEIDRLCKTAAQNNQEHFFDAIIKTAKNKAFEDWAEWAFELLKSAVYFVNNFKQSQKIYDLFPTLGKMYSGDEYLDKLLIVFGITERLEGKETADKYLMNNIDVPELRTIVIENAIAEKKYTFAEQLCKEAMDKDSRGHFNRLTKWPYFLEQIYIETDNEQELLSLLRYIIMGGDTAYFCKLKSLYIKMDMWDQERELLWNEVPGRIGIQNYVSLLSQEGELELLFETVKQQTYYIKDFGKQLAAAYPDEVYSIYEEYIINQAKQATDRKKYKKVCEILKSLAGAIGKPQVLELTGRL